MTARMIKIAVLVGLTMLVVISLSFAEDILVPQIGWPGTCEAQGWSADGRTALGFFNYPVPTIIKWNAKNWEVLSYQPLTDLADPSLVSYGTLSPDGRYLVVGIKNEGARIIDTNTNQVVMRFANALAGFTQKPGLLIEMHPHDIKLWNMISHKILQSFHIDKKRFSAAEVSPNGQLLFTLDDDEKGTLWNARTGKRLHTLKHNAPLLGPFVFSPDSRYLVTDGDDPQWAPPDFAATESAYARCFQLLLWDTRTGKRLLRLPDHYSLDGGTAAFIFIDKGRKLLSCGMFSIDERSIPSGKHIKSFAGSDKLLEESPGNAHRGPQRPFAISPDGRTLAAGPERWSLPSFKFLAAIPMYQPSANWLAFSPDGTKLAVITPSDVVAVWDLSQARVIRWIQPRAWSSDTKILFPANDTVATYIYANNIDFFSVETGKLLKSINPPSTIGRENTWTRLSPDGKLLAGDVYADDKWHIEVWDATTLSTRVKLEPLESSPSAPSGSAFSPNDRWLVVSAGRQGVMLYDLSNGKSQDMAGLLGQYAFSPDGSLVVGYRRKAKEEIGAIAVMVETATGKDRYVFGEANVDYWRPAAFSPDGKQVAMISGSRIRIYQADTGKPILYLTDVGAVSQIVFSPDGGCIAGTSGLGVTIWNATTGKVESILTAVPPDRETGKGGFWFSMKPDGSYIGSAGVEKHLHRVNQ